MVLYITPPKFRPIAEVIKEGGYALFQAWSEPVVENFKVPWNVRKLTEHGHF